MISAHKTNLAAHVLESPPRTEEMSMTNQPKIIQLLAPRPGWEVVYIHSEASDNHYDGKAWHTLPLECLALIEGEEEGQVYTRVVGMVMQDYATGRFDIVLPDDDEFLCYTHTTDPCDWQEEALKHRAHVKEQQAEQRKEWQGRRAHRKGGVTQD
jgi:hypothetical protein